MVNQELKTEIIKLIQKKTEGDYWDFKEIWHSKNGKLLHHIICMANNLANRDAYIIIGVDDSGDIIGVGEKNRKNQQNLIDFLKSQNFLGDIRPVVYVRTIKIEDKEVDVIIIKNTSFTPYMLSREYNDAGFRLYPGTVYTRVGDTNTPVNKTCDLDKKEYLWRKRFGMDLLPLDKIQFLLKNPKDWLPMERGLRFDGRYFCKTNPEFTITYKCYDSFDRTLSHIETNFYWLNKSPAKRSDNSLHLTLLEELELKYHSTLLSWHEVISADNRRFERTLWKQQCLFYNNSGYSIRYSYLEKDSLEYQLDRWLFNRQETIERTKESTIFSPLEPWRKQPGYKGKFNPYSVVPVFSDKIEHQKFISYVKSKRTEFLALVGDHNPDHSKLDLPIAYDPKTIDYLCTVGETLVKWLEEWRSLGESFRE